MFLDDNGDNEESSFMFDHKMDKHRDSVIDKEMDFKFDVIENFRDPLTRQTSEAVRISMARENKIFYNNKGESRFIFSLNRKSEVFAPRERFLKKSY